MIICCLLRQGSAAQIRSQVAAAFSNSFTSTDGALGPSLASIGMPGGGLMRTNSSGSSPMSSIVASLGGHHSLVSYCFTQHTCTLIHVYPSHTHTCISLTHSYMYIPHRLTRVYPSHTHTCISSHTHTCISLIHVYPSHTHTCISLTHSHVYIPHTLTRVSPHTLTRVYPSYMYIPHTLTRVYPSHTHTCISLTHSHVYIPHTLTRVYPSHTHTCISSHTHTCISLTHSHVYIPHTCIPLTHSHVYIPHTLTRVSPHTYICRTPPPVLPAQCQACQWRLWIPLTMRSTSRRTWEY